MERFTRSLVVVSLLAGMYFEARLASNDWPQLLLFTCLALLAGLSLAWFDPLFAPRIILPFIYIAPVIFTVTMGRFQFYFFLIWIGALVGLILGSPGGAEWAWPRRWKAPLVLWALTVACVWPLVVLREFDFAPALVGAYRLGNSSDGILPAEASVWIMDVAIAQLAGLLWFDWLFRNYTTGGRDRLMRDVVTPLAASAVVACGLGIYQGFFDLKFLSNGIWAVSFRAPGTLADANAFGMIAALWTAGGVAFAASLRGRAWQLRAVVLALVCWGGVWTSSSRTGLLAGAVALAFVLYGATTAARARIGRTRALAVVAATVALLVIALAFTPSQSLNPLARDRASRLGAHGVGDIVAELWNRYGYGTASTRMIQEFPLQGVGLGAFHTIVPDYTFLTSGTRMPPDNAQNWFRHELAELGLLGSAGWIWWAGLFAICLIRTRGEGRQQLPAVAIKGALAGFALASLVGVPGQNPAVVVTFWTLVFWYLAIVGREGRDRQDGRVGQEGREGLSAVAWGAIATAVVCQLALTAYAATHAMRVPNRAARFDWPYSYGLSEPARTGGRTMQRVYDHAVAVVAVEGPRLAVTVLSVRQDLAARPLRARVSVAGRVVIDEDLKTSEPLTREIDLPGGAKRVVVEVESGKHDRSLAIAWTFEGGGQRGGGGS